jgi:hypothetical protein
MEFSVIRCESQINLHTGNEAESVEMQKVAAWMEIHQSTRVDCKSTVYITQMFNERMVVA